MYRWTNIVRILLAIMFFAGYFVQRNVVIIGLSHLQISAIIVFLLLFVHDISRHTAREKSIFRSANIIRYIGAVIVLVIGIFTPVQVFEVAGNKIPTNIFQIVGILLFIWPTVKEWLKWKKEKG